MKFAPFKPCTLPKHVRVEILHREFPVKNLYFPCKGLQCMNKCKLSFKSGFKMFWVQTGHFGSKILKFHYIKSPIFGTFRDVNG